MGPRRCDGTDGSPLVSKSFSRARNWREVVRERWKEKKSQGRQVAMV